MSPPEATAIATLNEARLEPLHRVLSGGRLGDFRAVSDFAACLMPLLEALAWRGNPRHVAEAMPHFADTLDLVGLRNTLANLNYDSRPGRVRLDRLDPRLTPCLFVPDRGSPLVVTGVGPGGVGIFDPDSGGRRTITGAGVGGTAYFVRPMELARPGPSDRQTSWFRGIVRRFRPMIGHIAVVSLVLNILALGMPLFIMVVYDRVVGTGSVTTLLWLSTGIAVVLFADLCFRMLRSRMLAWIGARIDMIAGTAVFRHLLHLPPQQTERASIGVQIARLREFEAIREFFTGPLALVFADLPFTVVSIAVIAMIAGPLAIVPVLLAGIFVLSGLFLVRRLRETRHEVSRAGARRQAFLIETFSNMRTVRQAGAEAAWLDRFRSISAGAAFASFRNSRLSGLLQTLAHILMLTAGLATIAGGILLVLEGDMTAGALIATMALTWRVLAPLQTCFLSMTRLEQVRSGIRQMNNLMSMPPERDPQAPIHSQKQFPGRVTFSRVGIRYSPESEPAMAGVSFDAPPGQIVAIIGPNGSGKSTLLKLIAGLYAPQAGTVAIDGLDIRQLDPIELRRTIAYVPQITSLFHGTIAQNLRLADPTATGRDLAEAARRACVFEDILAMPEGFETRIGDGKLARMPAGLIQRLSLARAWLRDAPIVLLDEPGNALDSAGDRALVEEIRRLRGRRTVFMVTHRPSHMREADRIIALDRGTIVQDGPPDEVLANPPQGFL